MNFEKKILRENNFLYEIYNLRKVCYLYENIDTLIPLCYTKCKNDEELLKEKNKCIKFLEDIIMNNGNIKVNYGYGKNKNYGRLYAKNSSIQMISGNIRNFLLEGEDIVDIDIVNASCSIGYDKINQFPELDCPTLKKYVIHRQEVINENYQGDKNKCKDFINACFNSSKEQIKYYNNHFEINFRKDIDKIQEFYYNLKDDETITKIKEDCLNRNEKNDKNIKGKILNGIVTNLECQILLKAIDFYKKNTNKDIFCLFFDGFLAYKSNNENIIDELNKYIQKDYKSIKFIYKPIRNEIINMPNDYTYDLDKIILSINEKRYKYINNTTNFNDLTDDNYISLFMKLKKDDFVIVDKQIYVFHENKWHCDNEDLCKYVIKNSIIEYLQYKIKYYNYKLRNSSENYEDVIKELKNINIFMSKIKSYSKLTSIYKTLIVELSQYNYNNITFDKSLPFVFSFNNISFDIKTGNIVNVCKNDYITLNSGYDFIEPTQEQYKLIDNLFNSIFSDEETKKCYLSILWSGLSGIRPEKFFMANGCGRNGKGVINELMLELSGNYGFKGNVAVLTEKIKSGGNTEVANLNMKRFTIFNEPNDDETIKGGNLKRLTGDDKIDARQLFSKGEKPTILKTTIVFECNKKPNITGRIDESLIERFVDIPFMSYFTDDEYELKHNPRAKQQNSYLKEDEFKLKHKCALFIYLIENAPKQVYIPNNIKKRTREYLLDNDELYTWFLDNYQQEQNSFVKVKDVYYQWKSSDLFLNLSKKEKRKNNEKFFKRTIDENIELRKYYIDIHNYYNENNERKKVNSVLLNWKIKENINDCLIQSEEE